VQSLVLYQPQCPIYDITYRTTGFSLTVLGLLNDWQIYNNQNYSSVYPG